MMGARGIIPELFPVLVVALALAGTSDASGQEGKTRDAELQQLRDELAEIKHKIHLQDEQRRNERAKRIQELEQREQVLQQAEARLKNARGPQREADLIAARTARTDFIESALRTYIVVTQDERLRIRQRLAISIAKDQTWSELLATLEDSVVAGEHEAPELLQLFEATRQKLWLTNALTLQANRQLLAELLIDLRKRYPHLPHVDPGSMDFPRLFELLRSLSNEAFLHLASRAAERLGRYEPESSTVRERLRVAYFLDNGIDEARIRPFREAFGAWMIAASPDEDAIQATYRGWPSDQVKELMETVGKGLQCTDPPSSICSEWAGYAGFVAVELRTQTDGRLIAHASWRVRERGRILNSENGFPDEGFVIESVADPDFMRKRGNDFALEVLRTGTLNKQVAGVLRKLPDDSQLPRLRPPATLTTRAAITSTAVMNAGLPLLLDDSPRNDWAGAALFAADTAALGTIATSLWLSRKRREEFEHGERSSLHAADQMYGIAISAALTYASIKLIGLAAGALFQEHGEEGRP